MRVETVTVDGVRSPVTQAGAPSARAAVVLVHGNPGSARDWEDRMAWIAPFARVIDPATLESIADIEVLAIDSEVAAEWARLRVHLAQTGRRINGNDLWIAATAAAHGLPIVTQDDDFGPLDGVHGLSVTRV